MRTLQTQVRTTMENAFWDSIAAGLAQKPTDYKRFVSLIGEVREELEALVPEGWRDELRECMDLELISQVMIHKLSKRFIILNIIPKFLLLSQASYYEYLFV